MLSLMPLALFLGCLTYAVCLARLVTAACDAPIGYEDDDGFHYGVPVRVRTRP